MIIFINRCRRPITTCPSWALYWLCTVTKWFILHSRRPSLSFSTSLWSGPVVPNVATSQSTHHFILTCHHPVFSFISLLSLQLCQPAPALKGLLSAWIALWLVRWYSLTVLTTTQDSHLEVLCRSCSPISTQCFHVISQLSCLSNNGIKTHKYNFKKDCFSPS